MTSPNDALLFDATALNELSAQPAREEQSPLREEVRRALAKYFSQLDGQAPSKLFELVMNEVEAPMLEVVMQHADHNQSKAANMLGINRGTLRKKLKQYGML